MERRNFITRLFGVTAAGLLAPQIVKGVEEPQPIDEQVTTDPTPIYKTPAFKSPWDDRLKESLALTEEFFQYLEKHPPKFEWERVKYKRFANKEGHICDCSARKLRTSWTDGPIWDDLTPIFREIVEEIERYDEQWGFVIYNNKSIPFKHYFHQLYLIPNMIGPSRTNGIALTSYKEIIKKYCILKEG